MAREMLINVSAGEECRIALLDDNKLEELYMERTSATSHVGNIYKGKVTNVEASIQAAFVDCGIGRNGFLHISDVMPTYFGRRGDKEVVEPVGRKLSRRDRPPIQQCLRKGDEIIVQIIKEGIGTKGPTLSTYLSIPGRVLVMMPGMSKMGISKKLEDEQERARLRKILDGLKPPKDCGFIIRTAGIGKSKLDIERDLKYLARLWEQLKKKIEKDKPPVELYTEGDLVTRTVRDVFTSDVDKIVVDDKETARKIREFIKLAMPRTKNKVEAYEEVVPLFHKYDIEAEIERIYSRTVPLPGGGSLVIDQTEAVVAIDVNSGKFRDHSDAETTAFKTDMEAADEIPRQLKLRDMGGVIICDFIDLRFDRHRREVEQRLYENLKDDRAKTRMLRMSHFGIIEMTRQRMRPSLKKSIYQECVACRAHGMVKTPESMALDVMRKLRIAVNDAAVVSVQLTVHPDVSTYLNNRKRLELADLENASRRQIIITADAQLAMDEVKFELYDDRDGYIYLAEIGMAFPSLQTGRSGSGRSGRDGRENRDGRGGASTGGRDGPAGRRGDTRSGERRDGRGGSANLRQNDIATDADIESEAIDAEELFSEPDKRPAEEANDGTSDERPAPTRRGRGRSGRGRPEHMQVNRDDDSADESSEQVRSADDPTADLPPEDDETVVDVDEGENELPGNPPDAFFAPEDNNRRYDRHRRGGGQQDGRRSFNPGDRQNANRLQNRHAPNADRQYDDRDQNRDGGRDIARDGGRDNTRDTDRDTERVDQSDSPDATQNNDRAGQRDDNRQANRGEGERAVAGGENGDRENNTGDGYGPNGGHRRRRRRRGRRGRGGGDRNETPAGTPAGDGTAGETDHDSAENFDSPADGFAEAGADDSIENSSDSRIETFDDGRAAAANDRPESARSNESTDESADESEDALSEDLMNESSTDDASRDVPRRDPPRRDPRSDLQRRNEPRMVGDARPGSADSQSPNRGGSSGQARSESSTPQRDTRSASYAPDTRGQGQDNGRGDGRNDGRGDGRDNRRNDGRGGERSDGRSDGRNNRSGGRNDNRGQSGRGQSNRGGGSRGGRADDRSSQRPPDNPANGDRNRPARTDKPAGPTVRQDVDYDDLDNPVPAPGNELTPDTSPEAQRKKLDERSAANGRRGRRGGRGRGGAAAPKRMPVDRTGLPDDDELAREEAALLEQQARGEKFEIVSHEQVVRHPDVQNDADANTPPLEEAPLPIGETEHESDEAAVIETVRATRSRGGRRDPTAKETGRASNTARRKPPAQGPVVSTGSADKHLADDEPVDLDPVKPALSIEDLDELPDFDD